MQRVKGYRDFMMKKIIAIICAVSMLFSLAACSKQTDYSGQTITGQVTAIDGTKITLQLGELTDEDSGMPGDSFETLGDPNKSGNGQTPPDLPNDEQQGDGQTPPDRPSGEKQGDGQTPPDMPDGEMRQGGDDMQMPYENNSMGSFTAGEEAVTLNLDGAEIKVESGAAATDGTMENISAGSVLVVEVGEKNTAKTVIVKSIRGMGTPSDIPGGQPGGFDGFGEVTQGTSANTISDDGEYTGSTYSSAGNDENALRIDGAVVVLDGIMVDKSAGKSSNTEDGDFYGMNAALLATNGAAVTIKNAVITSSAQNGNGVFSYGSGTTVIISDSRITTAADNSGGIQTTGGGTTNAGNLTIATSGSSAAAIRSDRGGGTVNVNGGSYTTNGYNSPAVYSTASITVKNATLNANNSEALVIEGKNSIVLENCTVIGNMSDTKGSSSDINVHNVMIYQSMSGDADVGTSAFSMTGGTLTSQNGDMFYVTNTHCIIKLSGVEIINQDSDGYLLNVSGNSASHGWGTAGKNGGQVELTASDQTLNGDMIVDTISTLNMTLSGSSNFTGTINIEDNAQGGTAVDNNAVVTVESGSTWTLTGNCTVTSMTNNGTINFNGYTITLADGTVLNQ